MEVSPYTSGDMVPGSVYRVVKLLAQGGMGFIFEVEDISVAKKYVLKLLHPGYVGRLDLAGRMEAEARILAKLSHPNIVDVVTAGTTADPLRLPYYVMEKLYGESIRVLLDRHGTFGVEYSLRIACDLLEALACAHAAGIVHRDVKPDNVFLHRNFAGSAITKLLDFGIMLKVLEGTQSQIRGRFLGTLAYASPEQLQGLNVTYASDIYSAGLVIYEMIAGRGPFSHLGNNRAIARAHVHHTPIPLAHFLKLDPSLEQLLMSSLAKDPDERPSSAAEFSKQLRDLLPKSKVFSLAALTQGMSGAGSRSKYPEGFTATLAEPEAWESAWAKKSSVSGNMTLPLSSLSSSPPPPQSSSKRPSMSGSGSYQVDSKSLVSLEGVSHTVPESGVSPIEPEPQVALSKEDRPEFHLNRRFIWFFFAGATFVGLAFFWGFTLFLSPSPSEPSREKALGSQAPVSDSSQLQDASADRSKDSANDVNVDQKKMELKDGWLAPPFIVSSHD